MPRRVVFLAVLMAVLRSAAWASTDRWMEVRSDHFTVVTDADEKQARHLADQFERMRWMFQTLFPKSNVDPVAPIIVLAAKNNKVFQTMVPEAYLSKGALNLAGFFQSTADRNYILLRLDAEFEHPFASVYHEYTHLQFGDASAWMPLWLNEGFAEFIQNTEIRSKEILLGEPSADDILYLRQNRIIPLPVLFKVDHNSPYYHEEQKGSVFYSESWALTHFIEVTDKQKGTHRMDDYIHLVAQHEDPVAAAEKAFGDLKQLQKALESYISASTYKQFMINSAAAPIDESAYRIRILPQPEIDCLRADSLVGVQRFNDAQALIDGVLKSDPNNAQAHDAKASLEYRQGHFDDARKWYGEAIQLSSTNYFVYFNFVNLSIMQSGFNENPEMLSDLRKSIELNPRFYPASSLLASLLSSNGKNEDAIAVLQAAIHAPIVAADTAKAQSQIKQIEQRKKERVEYESSMRAVNSSPAVARTEVIVTPDPGPKHPTEPPTGPKHTADGIIRGVNCSYPSVIEFHVEGAKKSVALYSNDYFKIDLSVLGFTPEHSSMNPCHDFEGMKAKVQYTESSDKTVDGQVIAVELHK